MNDDEVEIEIINKNNETEIRPYVANKYIKEYYKTQEKFIDTLFSKNIVSYKLIGEIIGYSETITRNAITKSVATLDVSTRRAIDIFFNKDYFEELGKYTDRCTSCNKKCQQFYWVSLIGCGKYTEKKTKVKK